MISHHCNHCGYDLAGIPKSRCPECGLSTLTTPNCLSKFLICTNLVATYASLCGAITNVVVIVQIGALKHYQILYLNPKVNLVIFIVCMTIVLFCMIGYVAIKLKIYVKWTRFRCLPAMVTALTGVLGSVIAPFVPVIVIWNF